MIFDKILKPGTYKSFPDSASVTWQAPSNIALIKYWGKKEGQIPANASLSFTLSKSLTETSVHFEKRSRPDASVSFDFLFEGEVKADFKPKLNTFFQRIQPYLPFVNDYHMRIESENTFPHSSGIASSASGMAALALCLVEFESQLDPENAADRNKKASFIARLGSGSACRSIEGPIVHWGQHADLEGSSDYVGNLYKGEVSPVFHSFKDIILIVEEGQKMVSSTEGHNLMNGHPYASSRFQQAADNLSELLNILASGDLHAFADLVELEALSLHAMMMSSSPSYLLMKPNTLNIISRIREYRKESGIPVCFTLDAGANVHMLYPGSEDEKVLQFIKNQLVGYCQNGKYICDEVGSGATKIR